MKFGRGFGLVAFTVMLAALLFFSISVTQSYVSDTDASSYVIVPMLMLPLLAVFMFKHSDRIVPDVDTQSLVAGSVLFALFICAALVLDAYLGPLFMSYRMDMLLMPIAIISLALLIFGRSNLKWFMAIATYALFASPLLLLPFVNMNLAFASLNSVAIYHIAGLFFHGIGLQQPITLSYNGYQISIGNSCIGIGALIALALLLAPVAYFTEGRPRQKLLWAASGVALMLALNFLRMFVITVMWFAYGPNQSLLDFHALAGEIIFYLIVIVMLVVSGKYGLSYPRIGLGRKSEEYSGKGMALAIALTIVGIFVSAGYASAQIVPITSLGSNVTLNQAAIGDFYHNYLNYKGASYGLLSADNKSAEIGLANVSNTTNAVAIFGQNSTFDGAALAENNSVRAWKEYAGDGGATYLYVLDTNPVSLLYYSRIIYPQGLLNYPFSLYVVAPEYSGAKNASCQSAYEKIYGTLLNLASLNPSTFNSSLDGYYCAFRRLVR